MGLGGKSCFLRDPGLSPTKSQNFLGHCGRCVHPRNSPGGGQDWLGPIAQPPKSSFHHALPGSRTFDRVLIWSSLRASRTANPCSLCLRKCPLTTPRLPHSPQPPFLLNHGSFTSATLRAMPSCSFLQIPLLAIPKGPGPRLPPPGSSNTWRGRKRPENLKSGLESSPPHTHTISEDWGGLIRPGHFHRGRRI